MDFKLTSVADEEDADRITRLLLPLEDFLNENLGNEDFGDEIDRLVFVIVVLSGDEKLIRRFVRQNTGSGSIIDPNTDKKVKYLCLSNCMESSLFVSMADEDFKFAIVDKMVDAIECNKRRFPSCFAVSGLVKSISRAINQ